MRGLVCNKGLFVSEPYNALWVPVENFHTHTSVTAPLRDLGKTHSTSNVHTSPQVTLAEQWHMSVL